MTRTRTPQVMVGIETERGPWVASLVAAGYTVYALNPRSVPGIGNGTRPRVRSPMPRDAHLMAEIVRLDRASAPPGRR